jgi:thiosulfate/3-mercaptopyruvate sulfurtransferase
VDAQGAGLKELSVLNGGVQAWIAAGMALDPMPEVVQASTYTPTLDNSLMATREELLAQPVRRQAPRRAAGCPARGLLQGRTRATRLRWCPGTLKGAVNLEYTRWFAP